MSLERVLDEEMRKHFEEGSPNLDEQSLSIVRLSILERVVRFLRIPLDPADLAAGLQNRIVLSDVSLRRLDEAWYRIIGTFSDNRVSNQERLVREQLFFNAPFYVDVKLLSRFVGILAKKDATHGFENAVSPSTTFARNDSVIKGARKTERREEEEEEEEEIEKEESLPSGVVGHLKSTVLNHVLAVDGFRGVLPSNYKNYVNHLNDRLTAIEKEHLAGVRSMYASDHFVDGRHSGSFAAGCVFLTLLRIYSDRVGIRMEDFVRSAVDRAVDNVSRFVEDNDAEGDFRSREKFEKLAEIYREALEGDQVLEWIAFEKLKEYGKCAHVKYLF